MKKKQVKHRKRFCPKGHDTLVVGRTTNNRCYQCVKETNIKCQQSIKNGKPIKQRKQFCPKGHDTFVVGRYPTGQCKRCKVLWIKRYRKTEKGKLLMRKWNKKANSKPGRKKQWREWNKNYRKKHGIKLRRKARKHAAERRKTDINYKLSVYLRARLNSAIKNNQKVGSAIKELGCSIEFLTAYIQEQFYAGMTWDNWGSYWELDHIIELADLDLTDKKQFKQACHYTNLQPLTISDHVRKTEKSKKNRRKKLNRLSK